MFLNCSESGSNVNLLGLNMINVKNNAFTFFYKPEIKLVRI
jgi:hypothetical protein